MRPRLTILACAACACGAARGRCHAGRCGARYAGAGTRGERPGRVSSAACNGAWKAATQSKAAASKSARRCRTPLRPAKGGEVEAGKASHPGFFDIGGKIEAAINEWFASLVKDALNPAMVLVGRTLLSTPQIAGEADVRSYWQVSVGVADSLLVLVVMAAGALAMGHETLQTQLRGQGPAPSPGSCRRSRRTRASPSPGRW